MNFVKYLFTLILFILMSACSLSQENPSDEKEVSYSPQSNVYLHEKGDMLSTISFSAIGDILIHDRVYEDAQTNDGYDFMPMLNSVKPYLSDTTLSIANQETMIGGEEIGLSSYPSFNSPTEIGDALKELGIDVVTLANNHTLDRGEKAVLNAIEHWNKIDMVYTGAYESKEDQQQLRTIETDQGIDVSFLSYTYGTNGIPVPEGKSHLVNLIDINQMKSDIEQAHSQSEAIIMNLHAGDEYEPLPNEEQKDLMQFAADAGVDVVIGHHPHVLQPIEWVEGKDGHRMLAVYSLGNFLSGQEAFEKRVGGIIKFDMSKTEGEVIVDSPRFMLTYVSSEGPHAYEVLPMHELNESILPDYKEIIKEYEQHLSQWMPELEFISE
ncbi:CapA family protein [Halobacillus sp. A1]|uniref:CapA family protein n=1 Tax=Halobacillus sp. A1 TaxID=2880262 RepID=UPI0020A67760|nr:CapA family protein [Halobacillus sp. A1]MCP3030886.1 CapA family protein [Halobacillus sp. A1]